MCVCVCKFRVSFFYRGRVLGGFFRRVGFFLGLVISGFIVGVEKDRIEGFFEVVSLVIGVWR